MNSLDLIFSSRLLELLEEPELDFDRIVSSLKVEEFASFLSSLALLLLGLLLVFPIRITVLAVSQGTPIFVSLVFVSLAFLSLAFLSLATDQRIN